jgi:phage replication O-like protein O
MSSPQLENGYIKIANDIYDAFCRTRISGEERQILDCILRKTYGWNKCEDAISISQFADMTGIQKPHIIRAIKGLLAKNIISVANIGNSIAKNGNDKIKVYKFIKDYTIWIPLPKKATLPKMVMGVAKNGNPSLPKMVTTKDTTTKDTITKNNIWSSNGELTVNEPLKNDNTSSSDLIHEPSRIPHGALIDETETETETETEICANKFARDSSTIVEGIVGDNTSPSSSKKNKTYTSDFLSFYSAYPRHAGREAAWKAWIKHSGDIPPLDDLIKKINELKKTEDWKKDNGKFIPHPATWINGKRWEDEGVVLEEKSSW